MSKNLDFENLNLKKKSNFAALVIFKKVCETLTPYNSYISKDTKTSFYAMESLNSFAGHGIAV
jgi:hypothetical protein